MQFKISNNVTAVTNPHSMSSYTLLNIGFNESLIQRIKDNPEVFNGKITFVFNDGIQFENREYTNFVTMHIEEQYFSNKTYANGCKKMSKAFNLLLQNYCEHLTEDECLHLKYISNNIHSLNFSWFIENFKINNELKKAPLVLAKDIKNFLECSKDIIFQGLPTRLYTKSETPHICNETEYNTSNCRFHGLKYLDTNAGGDAINTFEVSYRANSNPHCNVLINDNRLTPEANHDEHLVSTVEYFERNISFCSNCDYPYNRELHDSEHGRCHICDESIENEVLRDAIHSYSYKPRAKFFYVDSNSESIKSKLNPVTKLNAGFEVEIEARDNDLSGSDNKKMMNKTALKIAKESNNFLYCKDDSSIAGNGGFEIVSHPATFNALRKMDLDNMFLKHRDKFKSFFTRSCGMHIHLSRSAFNDLQLYKFVLMLNEYKNFTHFVSQRRKYSEYEQWCGFKSNFHNDVKSDASWKIRKQKSEVKQGYQNKLKFQSNLDTGTRYQVVNLQNSKTIEIRCFKGNLDANGFRKNLDFVESMFYFCKDSSLQDLNIKNFVRYVRRDEKTYKHLNTFFKKNRITLNKVLKNPLEIENN